MKNKTEGEMILTLRRALVRMKHQGISPKHQVLDNEILSVYRKEIWATHIIFQLVLLDDHHHNLLEKAIQTWKDHFIGGMSVTASTFPVHLCCQEIPKAKQQHFLLRQSHVHTKVSAYAQIYGPHDYNAAPFLPIILETLVHDKPKRRGIFAEHCSKGYILGTAFEHYRAWTMWIKDKRATIISATVSHKHKYITNPSVTP